MATILKPLKWLYHEFGVASVNDTGRDAIFIILSRTCRMFAYGANSLIIALFFSALKFSDFYIGLFMTLTLLGDVLLSLLLTLVADKVGRRRVLFLGSFLMIVSGAVFAIFENFWILLFAAVVGVISATGGDFGPFRAIEESTLSHLTTPKTRSDVLNWYVTTSALGSAFGTEFAGRAVDFLQGLDGWTLKRAYHTIFWLYVVFGGLNMILILSMSEKCEISDKVVETDAAEGLLDESHQKARDDGLDDEDSQEETSNHELNVKGLPAKGYFSQISRETLSVMYKLWFLLGVDSVADGMTPYSLTTYYMDWKFHLSTSTLGDILSISYFLGAASTIFAGPLANRIGLVNTMVFTHLPSSAAVLLFAIPRSVPVTVALFFLRAGLNNMDQAPRSAFIAAVVKPEERTAVMGITSTLRTLSATAGPSVTGLLAGNDKFWVAFVVAGALRIAYDLGLFAMFVNMKLHKHEVEQPVNPRQSYDEEELRDLPSVQPLASAIAK